MSIEVASTVPDGTLPPDTILAERFRVESCLGMGGMGAVYAVHHLHTRHRRALKVLHSDMRRRADVVKRFLAEASAAGRVGSGHLVETFDAGLLPTGEPYLVMELLSGESLRQLLDREGILPVQRACELVAQAAEGIDAAHRASVIHRDLKPDNLFVTQRDGKPFVKVLDFGISKFTTETMSSTQATLPGQVFGTPAYMAPELFAGADRADARADVFALGAVLFECLSGESPFDAPSVPAIAVRLMSGSASELDDLRPGLDPSLVALVKRAIACDPSQRTPDARTFIEELTRWRRRAPTSSGQLERAFRPPSPAFIPHRLPAGPRRVWLAAVLLGAAALASLGYAWQRHVAEPSAPPVPPAAPPAVAEVAEAPPPAGSAGTTVEARVMPLPAHEEPRSENKGAPAARRRAPEAPSEDSAPSPVEEMPTPSPSRAQSLGLSEENPF